MTYTLTDKLKFTEKPKLTIKDVTVTIDNSATTVLELMDIVQNKGEIAGATAIFDLLLNDRDRKKITSLNLSIDDFVTVCQVMMDLALGNDPDSEKSGE